ncbi:MAG: threonine synthase [Victivallaceae bacterium]|nr:threonine synthase [Victivallaceae bacterium]
MDYTSTRSQCSVGSARTIAQGIADDGGLFVPRSFPRLDATAMQKLAAGDYRARAREILSLYLTDFTADEIAHSVGAAYSGKFENDDPAPLVEAGEGRFFLELWHGPTCAFKDMALQLLPHLLTAAAGKVGGGKESVILVATSGDTGKAALDGFADIPGTKIVVFYPQDGVSAMQKLQMISQRGSNVFVCGIAGNFDHAQSGVKAIFSDEAMKRDLAAKNLTFSSANSINFGRLAPQIVYYVSAYCDLVRRKKLVPGQRFNVAVPTGNFGNILAGVYARIMGVPVGKFICASNRNAVLSDFIATGVYDRNREFFTTTSPSMDILISSNLERMLHLLSGGDGEFVGRKMEQLRTTGRYAIPEAMLAQLQEIFFGGSCDDEAGARRIGKLFSETHYLVDPHTAVAAEVCERYREATGDASPCVIVSTASPYKFAGAVLPAIGVKTPPSDGFAMLEKLSETTGTEIPAPLAALRGAEILHKTSVAPSEMARFIRDALL